MTRTRLNACENCGHGALAHIEGGCTLCPCKINRSDIKESALPIPPAPKEATYTAGTRIGTTERLLEFHQNLCGVARSIMERKNRDYGSHEDNDPFFNFHMFEEVGILVRMSDKLSRLTTILQRGEAAVKEETIEDTTLDLINYAVLLLGYRHNKRLLQKEKTHGAESDVPKQAR